MNNLKKWPWVFMTLINWPYTSVNVQDVTEYCCITIIYVHIYSVCVWSCKNFQWHYLIGVHCPGYETCYVLDNMKQQTSWSGNPQYIYLAETDDLNIVIFEAKIVTNSFQFTNSFQGIVPPQGNVIGNYFKTIQLYRYTVYTCDVIYQNSVISST